MNLRLLVTDGCSFLGFAPVIKPDGSNKFEGNKTEFAACEAEQIAIWAFIWTEQSQVAGCLSHPDSPGDAGIM